MARFLSKSPTATKKIGSDLARTIIITKEVYRGARVVTLSGELGSGKTTFIKGFTGALAKGRVQSPTFVLMKRFPIHGTGLFRALFHIDAYRLKHAKDARILKLHELFADPANIVLIEWPEKIAPVLPKRRIRVHFKHRALRTRDIKIIGLPIKK